jgi:uncharacterized protein YcbK (DUF882 family)
MTKLFAPSRRIFLRNSAKLALAGGSLPFVSRTFAAGSPRSLALDHTHTREKVSLVYARENRYVPTALERLNHFLRDHYTGDVGTIDPQLFDILYQITLSLNTRESFRVISGYRCPATNRRLRTTGGGGVAKRSLHMEGKAIDVRLTGVPLAELRDAALSLRAGGVGFYPSDQFVHIDTGRVRSW